MNCLKCGLEVYEGDRFCKAGHSLKGMKLVPIAPAGQVVPDSPAPLTIEVDASSGVEEGQMLVQPLDESVPKSDPSIVEHDMPSASIESAAPVGYAQPTASAADQPSVSVYVEKPAQLAVVDEVETSPSRQVESDVSVQGSVVVPAPLASVQVEAPAPQESAIPSPSAVAIDSPPTVLIGKTIVSSKEEQRQSETTVDSTDEKSRDQHLDALPVYSQPWWKQPKYVAVLALTVGVAVVSAVMVLKPSNVSPEAAQVASSPVIVQSPATTTAAAPETAGYGSMGGQSREPQEIAAPKTTIKEAAPPPETKPNSSTIPSVSTAGDASSNPVKQQPKPAAKKASAPAPVLTYSRVGPAPQVASQEPAAPPVQAKPAGKTIDATFAERTATECQPGLIGIVCKEAIKLSLCSGNWSEAPPPGALTCRFTGQNNSSR